MAVIKLLLTTFTLSTATSAARVCPLDWPTLWSGGEITTVAPGLKFDPTSVICMRLAPCVENSGDELIRTGTGAVPTMSDTGFEVRPPPTANGLKAVTCNVVGVAMSEAKIVAVSCNALLNTVGRLLPLICTTELD